MRFGEEPPTGRLIALTPLIDVVFILLVFFMLASSFLDWRAVDLRVSSGVGVAQTAQRALLIRLKEDGSIALRGGAVDAAELEARVKAQVAEDPEQRFVIRPEPAVPLQRAVDMMDLLKSAGAVNVSFSRDR